MKRLLLALVFLGVASLASAQVVVNPVVNPSGVTLSVDPKSDPVATFHLALYNDVTFVPTVAAPGTPIAQVDVALNAGPAVISVISPNVYKVQLATILASVTAVNKGKPLLLWVSPLNAAGNGPYLATSNPLQVPLPLVAPLILLSAVLQP